MSDSPHLNGEILAALLDEVLLLACTPDLHEKFLKLISLLTVGQSRHNLTAIKEPVKMVRYHLADSVALERAVAEHPPAVPLIRAADVGTGGGFPLLPMAILLRKVQWVGIESVHKKAGFVADTAEKLELDNVDTWAARAEDVGRSDERATFDLVTSRAVGPAASLLEVCIPLLKIGGRAYLFKTEAATAEWEACIPILEALGAKPAGEFRYKLEGDLQDRIIFVAEKVAETPFQYPRAAGVPFKKPLLKWEPKS